MKKTINEASVKIDVQGLESSDLETLSRMLALAGQAEKSGAPAGMPAMAPLDFDSIGGDEDMTQPIMDPADAMSADSPADGAAALDSAVDDLEGTVTDFGDTGEDDISLDMDGEVGLQSQPEEQDDFGLDSIAKYAGLGESFIKEDAAEEEVDTDSVEDDELDTAEGDAAEEILDENQILPDLSIDEDAISGDNAPQDFGPFSTEFAAVQNAEQKTNGVEGDNFIILAKGNAYYWRRTVQENHSNIPDPEFYDTDGIEHSRHKFKDKAPGTALGDNPLDREIYESDEAEEVDVQDEDDNESVEDILESINAKYLQFLGGK